MKRVSCWANLLNNSLPTIKNKLAFANACIKIWKTQIAVVPAISLINISPNCLRVERATIFLASVSSKAERLATVNVNIPNNTQRNVFTVIINPNRINSQTPAVTRVDLCTKALTGVGAAIAAGSQLIKGHWALLVRAKILKVRAKIPLPILLIPSVEVVSHQQNIKSIIASPIRFVNKVKSPPFVLIQFW